MGKVKPNDFAASVHDPVRFQQGWLNRKLWQVQQDIARSIETHSSTAVAGCHASGKTFLASGLPLWWLSKHKKAKVLVTAPTKRQVKMFWQEIAMARNNTPIQQFLPEPSTEALQIAPDRWAMGATSSVGVNLQGLHGPNVLIIADEAPGIEDSIWDAIEGARSGGKVRLLTLGNPVIPTGYFYNQFTRERMNHHCIKISAFDTPNLQNVATGRPYTYDELLAAGDDELNTNVHDALITRRWVKERLIGWGPNHPKFQSRVLGEFPQESPYQVFPLAWINRAKREPTEKEIAESKRYGIQIGIDVAGPGDDETVCYARVLGQILRIGVFPEADPLPRVMQWIAQIVRDYPQYRLALIVVDIIGIGYNFALRIADNNPTWTSLIRGFRADGKPLDQTQFKDQKAEAAFTLRAWMKDNLLSGLEDEETEAQLCTILYQENARGLSELESKEDLRKKGVASPDRAEALMMAFHRVVPQQQTVTYDAPRVQISPI